ncbi:hypothetical protein CIPAW_06G113400 [Carya illinoinensis]|uniref:Uncharacterized protein n=1 Tax=Carya illinoinensis TaxID=32201 RepID=A0A8T1QAN3_CARIL|nr:hypothetical protein CIPAW_06G113400 [Carya illinoinensis]
MDDIGNISASVAIYYLIGSHIIIVSGFQGRRSRINRTWVFNWEFTNTFTINVVLGFQIHVLNLGGVWFFLLLFLSSCTRTGRQIVILILSRIFARFHVIIHISLSVSCSLLLPVNGARDGFLYGSTQSLQN